MSPFNGEKYRGSPEHLNIWLKQRIVDVTDVEKYTSKSAVFQQGVRFR